MASFNKVLIIGTLTRDPETGTTPNDTPVTCFGLAVNRKYRDAEGELQEETAFIDCNAYGRTATAIGVHMKKGRPILVDGHLRQDRWVDKEGRNRSKLKVVVQSFQFLDVAPVRQVGTNEGSKEREGSS